MHRDEMLVRWDEDLLAGIEAVGGRDTEAGARLDEMRRFFAFVRGEVPQLMAKWRELRATAPSASPRPAPRWASAHPSTSCCSAAPRPTAQGATPISR